MHFPISDTENISLNSSIPKEKVSFKFPGFYFLDLTDLFHRNLFKSISYIFRNGPTNEYRLEFFVWGKMLIWKWFFGKDSKDKLEAINCRKFLDKHILWFYDGNSFNICQQRKLNEKANLTQINQITNTYQMQKLHNNEIYTKICHNKLSNVHTHHAIKWLLIWVTDELRREQIRNISSHFMSFKGKRNLKQRANAFNCYATTVRT